MTPQQGLHLRESRTRNPGASVSLSCGLYCPFVSCWEAAGDREERSPALLPVIVIVLLASSKIHD